MVGRSNARPMRGIFDQGERFSVRPFPSREAFR